MLHAFLHSVFTDYLPGGPHATLTSLTPHGESYVVPSGASQSRCRECPGQVIGLFYLAPCDLEEQITCWVETVESGILTLKMRTGIVEFGNIAALQRLNIKEFS